MGSRSPDDQYDRDRERRRDDDWQKEPSNTVLIKSIPENLTEDYLFRWFDDAGVRVRDVRLVSRRGSRGAAFAFVEFNTVQAAADWMNVQQGVMKVTGDYTSGLVYSRRSQKPLSDRDRDNHHYHHNAPSDWTCSNTRCSFINFAKRRECFRCGQPKYSDGHKSRHRHAEDVKFDDGTSQVGANPCNTVILRGLDALTTEQSILESLAAITSLTPKNCYVMRDFTSGVSLGYAFMEFDSVLNGKKIKDHFSNNQPFEVDGKLVMVDYAKNTYSTILASIQYQNVGQAQQTHQPTEYELQALAANAANQVTSTQHTNQSTGLVAGLHQTQTPVGSNNNLGQYPEPDVTKYQWDTSSGYYYDPTTGLYYDANSQYYYNSTTQQFMYWDGSLKTYVPASKDAHNQEDKVKVEKEERKKKAKDIAKEMAKWAKSQNKKSRSASSQQFMSSTDNNQQMENRHTAADTAYDLLVGGKKLAGASNNLKDDNMMPPPVSMGNVGTTASGLVASYGGDESDDGDDDLMNEANHIDKQKLTCNLCERKFNSTAILEKHVLMSDLHKQNLMKLRQKSQGQFTNQYRDRAKERRMKEGVTPKNGNALLRAQQT